MPVDVRVTASTVRPTRPLRRVVIVASSLGEVLKGADMTLVHVNNQPR